MSTAPYDTNRFDGSTFSKHNNDPLHRVEGSAVTARQNGGREASRSMDEQWIATPPRTGPLPGASYKSPNYIPAPPKTTPSPPTFVKAFVPPLEPPSHPRHVDTFGSISSTTSSKKSSTSDACSPQNQTAVKALPGAMSSRRERERPRGHRSGSRRQVLKRKPTLAARWKSAVKSVFSSREIDESQFVRIEDHHWTEEW